VTGLGERETPRRNGDLAATRPVAQMLAGPGPAARVPTTMTMPATRSSPRGQSSRPSPVEPGHTSRPGPVTTVAGGLELDLSDPGSGAAWSIISYIFSGILFWGLLGVLADGWLFDPADDTSVFLPIGVILGAAAGGYLGYMLYLQVTNVHKALTDDAATASP